MGLVPASAISSSWFLITKFLISSFGCSIILVISLLPFKTCLAVRGGFGKSSSFDFEIDYPIYGRIWFRSPLTNGWDILTTPWLPWFEITCPSELLTWFDCFIWSLGCVMPWPARIQRDGGCFISAPLLSCSNLSGTHSKLKTLLFWIITLSFVVVVLVFFYIVGETSVAKVPRVALMGETFVLIVIKMLFWVWEGWIAGGRLLWYFLYFLLA